MIERSGETRFAIVIENRKGRMWVHNRFDTDFGNAAEEAMVLDEYLNIPGKKLSNPEAWTEIRNISDLSG